MTLRNTLHVAACLSIGFALGAFSAAIVVGCAVRLFLWTLNMGWVLP